jgi:hypothetical protein
MYQKTQGRGSVMERSDFAIAGSDQLEGNRALPLCSFMHLREYGKISETIAGAWRRLTTRFDS